ncbi:MAG: LIC_10190 family membrane protein, partial [Bacteroidia bacterium]
MLFVLIPVFIGFGEIFQKFFGRIFSGIASKLIAGIFSVSVIYTLLSFFFPLNMAVELSTLAAGISAFFYFQSYRECWTFFSKTRISFFVALLVTVFFGSYYPFILDHFGYYVPTVK